MSSPLPVIIDPEHPAVLARGLRKYYRKNRALESLDLTVPEGAVYLLVGPNGSGKTTTMKILLDLVRADGGSAAVFGFSPIADGPMVRAQIGYVPEGRIPGYEWMRIDHLLSHHAVYYPSWDDAYAAALISGLEIDLGKRFQKLSKGEARRVQLVMALAHRPPLLLLDEPMDGLDPVIRDRVIELVAAHLAETPTTVLASTHHIQELEKLADHLGVIRAGTLLAQSEVTALHILLKRYRIEVPAGWAVPEPLGPSVVRCNGSAPELALDIWGEEGTVASGLAGSGATVRQVSGLGLEEAAVSLLAGRERER